VLEGAASNWFGLQGFEYLDLARIYQVLLSAGLFIWVYMLWRVMRTRLRGEHRGNMPWLFFLAALAIPAFYAVGLIARTGDHFTVTEFWRFWVVHLWVEDFLELFTTVMVAYMFVLLGVVRERVALAVNSRPRTAGDRRRRRAQPRTGRGRGARGVAFPRAARRVAPAARPPRSSRELPRGHGIARAEGRASNGPPPLSRWTPGPSSASCT
jgi:hypothetical protein